MGLFGKLFSKTNYMEEYANFLYLLESGADEYGMQKYSMKISTYEKVCNQSVKSDDESYACMIVAILYLAGINTATNYEKAQLHLLNAEKSGNALAYAWLADIEEKVYGNNKKAIVYLRKGAKAGDLMAMNSLGVSYATGVGVKKDLQKAKKLWRDAYDKGYEPAGLNLRKSPA